MSRRYVPSWDVPRRPAASTAVVYSADHSCYVTDPYAKRRHLLAAWAGRRWLSVYLTVWLSLVAVVVGIGPLLLLVRR